MATEQPTRPPAFMDGKTQSANDMRLNILSGSGGATPLQSRAGVRPSGGNPGLVAALVTPVMKVRVNAGIADVPSSSVTGGFYRVSWDQVDLDIDPSSAQARTDLIIVEVVDTGTSAATGKVRVLKGTSGGGRPTNGVVNAHWFTLAATAVRVNAEGTGNIRPQDVTPELQYAVAPGAPIPVRGQVEEDALATFPLLTISRLDLGVLKVRNAANTGWQTVAFEAGDWVSFTPTLTATGAAPTMVSANRVGRYRRVDGDRIVCEMRFQWTALGTGEGAGTGDYRFALPVAASSWYFGETAIGSASYLDAGTSTYAGAAQIVGTTAVQLAFQGAKAGAASPVVPGNGDVYSFSLTYEAAS